LYLNVCGNAGDGTMEEDEVLSKITRLLERGCTMLATHHDCGAPLFRCQGVIVCPVCSFQDEQVHGEQLSGAGREAPELRDQKRIGRITSPVCSLAGGREEFAWRNEEYGPL